MSKDAKKVKATNQEFNVENMIDDLVRKANIAKEEMLKLDQEATDKIVEAMAKAGLDKHIELARLAVNETGRGIFEDKVTKNIPLPVSYTHLDVYKRQIRLHMKLSHI